VAIAKQYGIPQLVASFPPDPNPIAPEALFGWLTEKNINWIALAGFIKRFPLDTDWHGRIVNIHPALLPDFGGAGMYGMKVHRAVIASPAQWTGASIHVVTEEYDEGSVIAQAVVARRRDDTPESLAERVFRAECRLYPKVISGLVSGALPLTDGQVERVTYDDL
jgi:folate-dependent phosphoribosylglycinamide formyltransferase PurN